MKKQNKPIILDENELSIEISSQGKQVKERIMEKWKDIWLIRKESKVWWEKLVDECLKEGRKQAVEEVEKIINKNNECFKNEIESQWLKNEIKKEMGK